MGDCLTWKEFLQKAKQEKRQLEVYSRKWLILTQRSEGFVGKVNERFCVLSGKKIPLKRIYGINLL